MKTILSIDDMRLAAKRRLPRILFDWIDGGAGDEEGIARNLTGFRNVRFMPRYFLDVTARSQEKCLLGRSYGSAFGIAPTGYAGVFRNGADLLLCEAARDANLPYVMSGTSTDSLEDAVRMAPHHTWYQLYGATEARITEDLIRRAADAGAEALVITIDIPVAAKRERDIRNGFAIPLRISLGMMADALRHPGWTFDFLRAGGMPMMRNWARYAPPGSNAMAVANYANEHSYCVQTWQHFETFRRLWPRKLIVKGVMRAEDAARAVALGADGLIVSNHGGRQYDRAPTALETLPIVKAAVPKDIPVMLDGGIRRGSDILAALCLGADFTFVGRATLYGVAAGGAAGAAASIRILREELDQLMGQIGCLSLDAAGPDWLLPAQKS